MTRLAAFTVILGALALSPAGPVAAQACLGTALSEGGGAARAHTARVAGVPVFGVAAFMDPASPVGLAGAAEWAAGREREAEYGGISDGSGIHVGGRAVYQMGRTLGTTLCLTLGPSFYQSQGRFRDGDGRQHRFWNRTYSAATGIALGFLHFRGPLVINPYALAEVQFVHRQMRAEGPWAESVDWMDQGNEGRAALELGVATSWQRFLLDAAALVFPGSHSILEAFHGDEPAGGQDAGFRVGLGVIF